jgi:N utilization substance protein A
MIKFSSEEINFIRYFESQTGAIVKDCIIKDDITVIVKNGDIGIAIGKKGTVVNKLKKEIGKEIHIYAHSDDPALFIINLLYPIRVEKVEVNGNEAHIYIDPSEKKRAIGRGGKKINAVKEIARRHFGIEKIFVD